MSEKISAVPEALTLEATDLFALAKDTGVGPTGFESSHVSYGTLVEQLGTDVDLTENTTVTNLIDESIDAITTTTVIEGDNLYFTPARIRTEVEEETGPYTLVLADADHKWKTVTGASDFDITIPADEDVAWPEYTYIEFMQGGLGAMTFVGDTGVEVLVNGFLTATTNGPKAVVALKKQGANSWAVFGNLEPN